MRLMVLLGLALVGVASEARAADFGPLRGSQFEVTGGMDWSGAYVGLHAGFTGLGADMSGGTSSLIAHLLRNTRLENTAHVSEWTTLGTADTRGTHFGGFAGYNVQFENVVVGVEATYSRTDLRVTSSDSMARIVSYGGGDSANVQLDASTTMHLTDYGTLRVRGGWSYGNFLPYGFVGAALGRATVTRTVRVSGTETIGGATNAFDLTASDGKADDFAYGIAGGFGVEFALFQNLFVRGEYEFIKFGMFNDLNTYVQSARIGAGVKF